MFWSHTKLHSSKTVVAGVRPNIRFWSHTKLHSSKTSNAKIFFKFITNWFRNHATNPSKTSVSMTPQIFSNDLNNNHYLKYIEENYIIFSVQETKQLHYSVRHIPIIFQIVFRSNMTLH